MPKPSTAGMMKVARLAAVVLRASPRNAPALPPRNDAKSASSLAARSQIKMIGLDKGHTMRGLGIVSVGVLALGVAACAIQRAQWSRGFERLGRL